MRSNEETEGVCMAKTVFGSALFLGGCLAGFAFMLFEHVEDVYRVILANFSLSCIVIGLILGVAGMIEWHKSHRT